MTSVWAWIWPLLAAPLVGSFMGVLIPRLMEPRQAAIGWRVVLAALLIPISAASMGVAGSGLWAVCAAGWVLLALAWIDWNCMILPDALTLPLVVAGLLATWWLEPFALTDHALAAALGYTALRGLALLYRRLRGRDGLGEGDAKLLAALGAWVGLDNLPSVVLGAALAGLAWAGLLRLRGAALTGSTALPFGPFLALSGWVVLLRG